MEITILLQPRRGRSRASTQFDVLFLVMSSAVASLAKPRRSRASIVISAVVRILLFAITCAGLGMAFGLFGGILVQVVRSLIHRGAIDMTVAYRYAGIPLASLCGLAALVVFGLIETRTARRLLAER